MDNEKKNDQQEQDWLDLSLSSPDTDTEANAEADLAAQQWLEQLLASTAPEEPARDDPPQESEAAPDEEGHDEALEWFSTLESPAEQAPQIGTDEHAVSQHDMSDIADMELDKIMQEAMSEDWDLDAIDREILADPDNDSFSEEADADNEAADLYSDDEPQEQIDTSRKVRPKRKNGYGLFGLPHLASMAIWAVICVTIGISLGRLLWICAADILAFGRQDQSVVVTITAEDNLDTVTAKLKESGLIKYEVLFKFYCNLAGKDVGDGISPGVFTLNTLYDYHALVKGMNESSSYRETIKVPIPEGYTCAQIFALLEEKGVCTVAELEAYCEQSEFSSYWFLEDVEKGTKYCLEGFLFPDTYEFYIGSSARLVFIKFLDGFENHFDESMQQQLETLNETLAAMYRKNGMSESYIEEHKMTVYDVVTVASMIEKETAYSGESQTIASVIYNRLTNPSNYPKLNIDATVVYALGGKKDLTSEDLKFDSPYNTYLYDGLPPGPISNPGSYSLKAALTPADTGYYFYALDTTDEVWIHRFFKTYDEHQAFVDSLR